MARTAAPEGAKKLYMDEKTFKKIDKLTAEVKVLKKRAKKENTAEIGDQLVDKANALLDTVLSKWDGIKLMSGIKPEAEKAPAKKAPAKAPAKPKAPKAKPVAGEV